MSPTHPYVSISIGVRAKQFWGADERFQQKLPGVRIQQCPDLSLASAKIAEFRGQIARFIINFARLHPPAHVYLISIILDRAFWWL